MASRSDEFKRQAAEAALDYVESGMVVGLGSGSTSLFMLEGLAQRLADGRLVGVQGVPSSREVEEAARELGVPLTSLELHPWLDLTIDGADEVDPRLNLIKGHGGALLREKIVAQASRREIIIVDESKLSSRLGERWAVPVEVAPFGWRSQALFLESLGAQVMPRQTAQGRWYQTDNYNYILDCTFGPLDDPGNLAHRLDARGGILEHGLFLGLTDLVVVAGGQGIMRMQNDEEGGVWC
ncbi:MAG: ribose-5-phosphate isomerase RpiA [Deltaproteobacteria bacterium]|nr:ribose-5-phosphate isomerase RpiA [Deltaproteobacteria bacterium]